MTDSLTDLFWAPDPDGDPAALTYTFGGVAPVASVRPRTRLSTWTFDCFGGRVRSTSDLPSEVCDPRLLNPQTGPFYVEGAENVRFCGVTADGIEEPTDGQGFRHARIQIGRERIDLIRGGAPRAGQQAEPGRSRAGTS